MSKRVKLESLFDGVKFPVTKQTKEFGLLYDKESDCLWFGEKKAKK